MTTIRLPVEIEKKLDQVSKAEHESKSSIIKNALKSYLDNYNDNYSAYEIGKSLFGKYGSRNGSLSSNYKKILKGKLREKNNS